MKKFLFWGLLLCAAPCFAQNAPLHEISPDTLPPSQSSFSVENNQAQWDFQGVTMRVLGEDGQILTQQIRDGWRGFDGKEGEKITLEVTNHTQKILGVILSLDNKNIQTGRLAVFADKPIYLAPNKKFSITTNFTKLRQRGCSRLVVLKKSVKEELLGGRLPNILHLEYWAGSFAPLRDNKSHPLSGCSQ